MACKCAKQTDEWHGWECSITEGPCMYFLPDSKKCAEEYGEGPSVGEGEQEDQEQEELEKAAILIARYCNDTPCSECKIKDFVKCNIDSDCMMTPYGWGKTK